MSMTRREALKAGLGLIAGATLPVTAVAASKPSVTVLEPIGAIKLRFGNNDEYWAVYSNAMYPAPRSCVVSLDLVDYRCSNRYVNNWPYNLRVEFKDGEWKPC